MFGYWLALGGWLFPPQPLPTPDLVVRAEPSVDCDASVVLQALPTAPRHVDDPLLPGVRRVLEDAAACSGRSAWTSGTQDRSSVVWHAAQRLLRNAQEAHTRGDDAAARADAVLALDTAEVFRDGRTLLSVSMGLAVQGRVATMVSGWETLGPVQERLARVRDQPLPLEDVARADAWSLVDALQDEGFESYRQRLSAHYQGLDDVGWFTYEPLWVREGGDAWLSAVDSRLARRFAGQPPEPTEIAHFSSYESTLLELGRRERAQREYIEGLLNGRS